ncbi:MAG: NAD(P)/FAD-dependent oxidoreductase [Chloroflexi bacterium]|nr:NAD(P)/FAD-dependent oxidoreductase [Chloroflexota bacterium]
MQHVTVNDDPVVIIGASSAGLFAAQLLAESRVPVHVFERAEELQPHARTLIVTPELQHVLGASAAGATVNTVHTLDLCTRTKTVPIALGDPDLVIERANLVCILSTRAQAAGAVLHLGHDFVDINTERDRTTVEFRRKSHGNNVHVPARTIIAADGAFSHVASALGLPRRPTVTVMQARVVRPRVDDEHVGKVWFLPNQTRYFYWLCPESDDIAAVGIVDDNPREARRKLDGFLAEQKMRPLEYQGAYIPLYRTNPRPWRRVGRSDVLFIGDAAAQVKVTTIGGTVTGLWGARAAAQSILRGSSYLSELRSLNRELQLHWLVRGIMHHFFEHEYDALLQLLGGRVGDLFAIHNRDRMAGAFWPMLTMQPRLPLLAAQVLWRAGFGS